MSEVTDLNDRLRQHSEMLLKNSTEYAKLARAAVDARNAYDVAKAKAQLIVRTDKATVSYSVAEKAAEVLIRCEPEMIEARISEAHLDAMSRRLRAVEASLGAIQSQAKLLKTESNLNRYET